MDGEIVGAVREPPLRDAVHSVVPATVLERLGVQPLDEQEFRLAEGTKVTRRKGGAVFRYEQRVGVADVIFGEDGAT